MGTFKKNSDDCGLFAIATATALAHNIDPMMILFDETQLRSHLIACFQGDRLTSFPVRPKKVVVDYSSLFSAHPASCAQTVTLQVNVSKLVGLDSVVWSRFPQVEQLVRLLLTLGLPRSRSCFSFICYISFKWPRYMFRSVWYKLDCQCMMCMTLQWH